MNKLLEPYLNPGFEYKFTQGPDLVRTREDAIRNGINCVSLAHLALKDLFDYKLPSDLMCVELHLDAEHFNKVDKLEDMQAGDLVWFGVENPDIQVEEFTPVYANGQLMNWADFPVKHVAVYTGGLGENNDYLLLHSTHVEGTNVIWPLEKFKDYVKYRKIYGISRLKVAGHAGP